MNGFDDFDTQVTAEEFYSGWTEDEADYIDEGHLSMYDDDPSPYDGTYSEE